MRNALNNNPVVQAVVIGMMALIVAFLLFTRVLNQGGDEAPPAPASGTAPAPGASAPPSGVPTPAAPAPAAPAPATPAPGTAPAPTAPSPAAPAAPDAVAADFEAGPGLPQKVVDAYEKDKAVVLMIVKAKGRDDRALRRSVDRLRGRGDVVLFVIPVKRVAKYARVTEGVDLNRVPAIVVIRPKSLSGEVPEAIVRYGFRGPASVEQAVEDAIFDGKGATYDP